MRCVELEVTAQRPSLAVEPQRDRRIEGAKVLDFQVGAGAIGEAAFHARERPQSLATDVLAPESDGGWLPMPHGSSRQKRDFVLCLHEQRDSPGGVRLRPNRRPREKGQRAQHTLGLGPPRFGTRFTRSYEQVVADDVLARDGMVKSKRA